MKKLLTHFLKTKKIIARETLITLICIIIPLLIFAGLYINSSIQRKSLEEQLKQTESLITDYKNSPKHFNRENFLKAYMQFFKSKNISIDENSLIKAWNRLVYLATSDSIEYKWNNEWEPELIQFNKKQGFKTPDDFKKFIIENSQTKKEIYAYNGAITKKWDLESKIAKIDNKNNIEFAKISFYFLLLVLFGLRYLWYLISWCIKTIKL